MASTPTQMPPLRGAREARGVSLRQLAKEAAIDPAQLSRIERGLVTPSVPVLRRLYIALGLRDQVRFLAPYDRREPGANS